MATGPTSFVPEDVMKLFVQSFSSGVGANEAAQRIGLARTAQAQEFQLGTGRLALQNQELALQKQEQEQRSIDTSAKIALQRENIASDSALKGQEIAARVQENAKGFLLKQQAMEQDKLQFAEELKARRAAQEFQRTDQALKIHKLEEETRIKQAQLELAQNKNSETKDYRQAALDRQTEEQRQRQDARKMSLLAQEQRNVRKDAYNTPGNEMTGVKKEFQNSSGGVDEDKIWEIAKSRVNRLMDSTGGSTQSFPDRPKEQTQSAQSSQANEPGKGPLERIVDHFKEGQRYVDKNGEARIYKGGKWVPE